MKVKKYKDIQKRKTVLKLNMMYAYVYLYLTYLKLVDQLWHAEAELSMLVWCVV